MDAASLAASACINIGLALVVLTLFSVFKKQPGNAPVYYARQMALAGDEENGIGITAGGFSIMRLCPSVAWIPSAFRMPEDEVLQRNGLDSLVVLRLFKLGIRFFTVCSLVGLLVLVPVNYTSQGNLFQSKTYYSMDSFTISILPEGSNRLWIHFVCLWFVSFYVLYLLYKEYKVILAHRILHIAQNRQRPDQFTVLVRGIPLCVEHTARGCNVDHFFSKHYTYTYQSHQIVYDGRDINEAMVIYAWFLLLLNLIQKRGVTRLASSLQLKVKKMRSKTAEKQNKLPLLRNIFRSNATDVDVHEERLQEVCHRIRLQQCECILEKKELPVAFVSFKTRFGAALAAQTQQHIHPLFWMTEFAPEPRDVIWNNLAIPYHRMALNKVFVFIAALVFTIFFAFPVTAVQGIAQFENIKKWFPPARAVQLIPGLSSIITGYLPGVILSSFIYVVPYVMLFIASLEGCVSKSKKEMKACSMVFYFLVGNVFFLSLLSGSLLHQIGESFSHPKDFPSHLASAVSAQSDFFITYILTDGLSGFSLEALQFGFLIWHFLKTHSYSAEIEKDAYLYGFPFYRVIPIVSLAMLIGMVYAVVAPLLLPFLLIYFLLGYAVYVNQMQDVYDFTYDTFGGYWPYIHHYIFITIILMQITMVGLFGLKSKPAASISTIPLIILTILFNEYCKVRFLPTFCHQPIQNAKENDDLDEKEDQLESNSQSAANSYNPPWMRLVNYAGEASSTEPLVSSS